jgi:hypothetical protein
VTTHAYDAWADANPDAAAVSVNTLRDIIALTTANVSAADSVCRPRLKWTIWERRPAYNLRITRPSDGRPDNNKGGGSSSGHSHLR